MRSCGPDTGIFGQFHRSSESRPGCAEEMAPGIEMSADGPGPEFRNGGPPTIPPSMSLIFGAVDWMWEAISRALRGDIAFRSR